MRTLIAVFFLTALSAQAREYTWKEDGRVHRVYLVPGFIADFSKSPRLVRGSNLKLKDKQSPVFTDGPQGGSRRALPGGVIVTFSKPLSEADVRDWAMAHGAEIEKPLAKGKRPMYLIRAPAGLESLDLANRLSDNHVESAVPNWWIELKPR